MGSSNTDPFSAIAAAALATGAIPESDAEGLSSELLAERIGAEMWDPEYVPYRYQRSQS